MMDPDVDAEARRALSSLRCFWSWRCHSSKLGDGLSDRLGDEPMTQGTPMHIHTSGLWPGRTERVLLFLCSEIESFGRLETPPAKEGSVPHVEPTQEEAEQRARVAPMV